MVTDTLNKFPSNIKPLGAADVMEDRTAIQKNHERLDRVADMTHRRRKHPPCVRDSKPPCSKPSSG